MEVSGVGAIPVCYQFHNGLLLLTSGAEKVEMI